MKAASFSKRQEQWNAIINEQRASGLSQAKFCEGRGISKSSFGYWSSILKKKGKSGFAAVRTSEPVSAPSVKIIFTDGAALHFAEAPDPEWMAELLRLVS